MKTIETSPAAVMPHVVYRLGENVYRLISHDIAVIDEENNTAMIIQAPQPQRKENK